MSDIFVVTPCASAKAYEIKLKDKKMDLAKAEAALAGRFDIIAATPVMLLLSIKGKSVTIYSSSIMMKDVGEAEARKHAASIIALLKKHRALL